MIKIFSPLISLPHTQLVPVITTHSKEQHKKSRQTGEEKAHFVADTVPVHAGQCVLFPPSLTAPESCAAVLVTTPRRSWCGGGQAGQHPECPATPQVAQGASTFERETGKEDGQPWAVVRTRTPRGVAGTPSGSSREDVHRHFIPL